MLDVRLPAIDPQQRVWQEINDLKRRLDAVQRPQAAALQRGFEEASFVTSITNNTTWQNVAEPEVTVNVPCRLALSFPATTPGNPHTRG
jgi:hypothetical protein